MQVNLPDIFADTLHVTQVNFVWDLFTCVVPDEKIPAFAYNVTVLENHLQLQENYNGRGPYIGSKIGSDCWSSSIHIQKHYGQTDAFKKTDQNTLQTNYQKHFVVKKVHIWAILADSSPCWYEVDKTRHIPRKNSKVNPFVVFFSF